MKVHAEYRDEWSIERHTNQRTLCGCIQNITWDTRTHLKFADTSENVTCERCRAILKDLVLRRFYES